MNIEVPTLYCFYPYSLSGLAKGWKKITGMEALISREFRLRSEGGVTSKVNIICDGEPDDFVVFPEADLSIQPVNVGNDPSMKREVINRWFDALWAIIHPAAFTSPSLKGELAKAVYPESNATPGSFKRVEEHIQRRRIEANADPDVYFADCFEEQVKNLPEQARVNWIEVFFTECILRCKQQKKEFSSQSLHSFLVVPDNLIKTSEGRRILKAYSCADKVYLQTDAYRRRLERQLLAMSLPIPELHRFDLPPDSASLRRFLRRSEQEIALSSLDNNQQVMLKDAMSSKGKVPHRFVCPDRLDPIKGIHVVLQAVDSFLSKKKRSLEELRNSYRFYFVTDYYTRYPEFDESLAWHRYAEWLRTNLIPQVQKRWPGIVFFADNISDRFVWSQLLVDAHCISGGIQEGLGLAVQEGLIANQEMGLGRSVIIGDGAGFALQAREDGFGDLCLFPEAGNVEAYVESLESVTQTPDKVHLRNTSEMVERFIEPHNHRLLP